MLREEALGKIKRTAWLINTARGGGWTQRLWQWRSKMGASQVLAWM